VIPNIRMESGHIVLEPYMSPEQLSPITREPGTVASFTGWSTEKGELKPKNASAGGSLWQILTIDAMYRIFHHRRTSQMPSLNISLPAPLREWIEAQIKGGRYGNASEYLRELIRRDQERQAQERLERLLLDGVESGKASPLTKKDWAELRTEVAERLEKRRGGRGKKSR
jgi:antitoxin ParD1/3/4